jgi:hypothetical protein
VTRRWRALAALWALLVLAGAGLTSVFPADPALALPSVTTRLLHGALFAVPLALLGTVVTALASRARRPALTRPAAEPTHAQCSAATADDSAHRDVLVQLCVELHDAVDRPALRERLIRTLESVGVRRIDSDGAVFDAAHHLALDRVPCGDPTLHNRVAATERAGYLDRGVLLRPAEVTVYRSERADG